MDKVVSISFGELFLKGKNRQRFVDRAIKRLGKKLVISLMKIFI